ncbi:transcription antitermination factor NusB [Planctomonas deserti]|jgi:N utilization substance protein B|uniref:transcription antitermination factor NusB n=1 Tax=Planctomonas deserti TaxID=2144185 RepID=UPI000D333E4A|nr:transcription antitermination factor NusB [Planctomonas deserti]
MSARTKARKRALDVLYVADVRQISIQESLDAEAARARLNPERDSSWAYARQLVTGVMDHFDEIDELIVTFSVNWTLARMPTIDRAILRLGIWEILYNDEVPNGVAISEAVELAQTLSTDDSASFVNGMLARIAQTAG